MFQRVAGNPLLTPQRWPYPVNAVLNPAATLVCKDTVLLCRVEDRRGISHLTVARSADGVARGCGRGCPDVGRPLPGCIVVAVDG